MKTLSSFYLFTVQPIKLLAVSAFLLFSVGLKAQNKTYYKVAAYELNKRYYYYQENEKYKYEIRGLFVKSDSGWTVCEDSLNETYLKVYKGNKYGKMKAFCCTLRPDYDSQDKYKGKVKELDFFAPKPSTVLSENYFSKQFNNDEAKLIKKACLLSNNSSFRQNTKLAHYMPSKKEKQWLLDTAKIYMENLFRSNRACIERNGNFVDTVIRYGVRGRNEITIDTLNSFIDNEGNKIINILLPANTKWNGMYVFNNIYPFNEECFREDNGFDYYRILCYMANNGKLTFLHDEMQYLDHGDFDNDGKDEFIFWTAIFNHVGYIMYYDDFKKKIEYKWSYH